MPHHRSGDYGLKLASVPFVPIVNDVPTMDRLTNRDLDRLIVQELDPGETKPLSHVLTHIFDTFTSRIPAVDELKVPLHKISYRNHRINQNFANTNKDESVPLYDTVARCWNWALPTRCTTEKSPDNSVQQGEDAYVEEEGSVVGGGSGSSTAARGKATRASTDEMIVASFLNTVAHTLIEANQEITMHSGVRRYWSAANSTRPVQDEEISRKPDITLLDDVVVRWDTIKTVCELTSQPYEPASTLAKSLDSKAYILLRRQPWRRFVLLLSLCNKYQELRVHLYDHSGGVVSPSIHIHRDPDKYLYILSCIIFGRIECLGYDPTITLYTKTIQPAHFEQSLSTSTHAATVTQAPDSTTPTHNASLQIESAPPINNTPSAPPPPPSIESALSVPPLENLEDDPGEPFAPLPQDPLHAPLPQDPLHIPLPETIGKIRVKDNYYDILEILFSSQGLVGRGTVCYRTKKDDEEFIIKDHWVLNDRGDVLNEAIMLEEMRGVHGIPDLVEHWLVEIAPGVVDKTADYRCRFPESTIGTFRTHVRLVLKPRARPLHKFRTKVELVGALRDIVKIQKTAVEKRKILHRDGSLNNAMIVDDGDGSYGTLIDWEFAVRIIEGDYYTIGGTGTMPFMSRKLLYQLAEATRDLDESTRKQASSSRPYPTKKIRHTYADDLESLFYVFVFICIEYGGPLGMKRKLKGPGWLPYAWSANTYKECNEVKTTFFYHLENVEKLQTQFDPYFGNLVPLAKDWFMLIRNNGNPDAVRFDDVLRMLKKHYDELPKDEPPPELVLATAKLQSLKRKLPSIHAGGAGNAGEAIACRSLVTEKSMTVEAGPSRTRKKARTA